MCTRYKCFLAFIEQIWKITDWQLILCYEKTDTTTDTHQDAHQDKIYKPVEFCSIPRSRAEMQEFVKLKDKVNFKRKYLAPMLALGLIKMTIPDKPTSRHQKYVAANSDKIT